MSIYGQTKGTELEKVVKNIMQAEANGTMMYYALARMAKEQGYDDLVDIFIEAANQEAVHAGFYATLMVNIHNISGGSCGLCRRQKRMGKDRSET